MLVWGIAALAVGAAFGPVDAGRPAHPESRPTYRASYRVASPSRANPVDRTTPVLDVLTGSTRPRRHARHSDVRAGNLTLALESARSRPARELARTDSGPGAIRVDGWREAKQLAGAMAADWAFDDGHLRLAGGVERLRAANAGLRRGSAHAAVSVVELDYAHRTGWSAGGGWRTVSSGGRPGDNRLAILATGAPPTAAGGFVQSTLALGNGATVRIEGGVSRLDPGSAAIMGGTVDRRATVTLRRAIF